MKQRMKKMLSGDVDLLLRLAACLGSTVDKRSLVHAWEDFKSGSKEIDELLDTLVRDGYLCKVSNAVASYRWVHGAIQEASLSLIPEDELMALQFRVGNVLVAKLSEEELEASIFVVVNLLNAGSPVGREVVSGNDGLISHLNFQAALKSVELSALEAAAKYSAIGVDSLPSHRWEDDLCDLTLDLYSTAAEIEGHLGMLDQMNAHCNEVLEQHCLSFFDKLRVFNVLMDSIYIREGVHEAIELCLFVLGQLGCHFPQNKMKRNIRVLGDMSKMRDTIKFCSSGDIENLSIMQDTRQIEVMKVLDRLVTYCYLSGNTLLPLVLSKSIRWSFRYGLCLSSPPSLAAVGAFLCSVLSDFDNGTKCGEHALVALECLKRKVGIEIGRTMESRTLLFVHGVVFHWTRPLPSISRQFLNAYEIGMQTGDIDSAIWSILHYLLVGFHSGRSLEALEADCRMYVKQGEELKREQQICLIALLWQAILNLMGRSVNPTVLTGEAMDQDRCLELAARADNPHLVGWVQALRAVLYSCFGEYEAGSELGVAKGTKLEKILPSHLLVPSDPFYRGVCLFEMARRTKKQKYKKRARTALDTIKAWVSKGNPNLKHCERFLEAELAALTDNSEKAKQHYAKAVVLAARGGFIHHAAMANERYGEFLLNALDLPHDAAYRFDEAIKFYSVWGSCKADMLREKYSYLKR
jgi:predicted ATPase